MPASPAREVTGYGRRPLSAVVVIFGSVGVVATLSYFLLANLLSGLAGFSVVGASVCAYFISAMFSYLGHKHWSFASKRAHAVAVPRFLISTAIGLTLAYLLAVVAAATGLPSAAAYVATCIIVPIVNFFLLGKWVFEDRPGTRARDGGEVSAGRLRLGVAGGVLAATALAACSFSAWRWALCPDTSWLITVAERIISGDRLYIDLMEVNPPFSVWLYLPPVGFADLIGVAPEPLVRLYVLALCLAGTLATGWMLARSQMLSRTGAIGVALVLFAITALLSGNSFTERDQIGAVLALPLFVLAAWRSLKLGGETPTGADWIVAGVGAGVFAMVKPYYAVVVVTVACMLVFKRRDIRMFFLPEFVLSAAITLAYLVISYVLYPAFFETFLPLLQETYMAFRRPLDMLLLTAIPWLTLPFAYAFRRHLLDAAAPSDFFMIGALAAWIPYFFQGKAWPYHAYPATLFGCAALVVALTMLLERLPRTKWAAHIVIVAVAVLLAHLRFIPTERPSDVLVEAGLRESGNPTVGMLGGGIEKGHPLTRMVHGRWIEPYCSDWIPVYVARKLEAVSAGGDGGTAEPLEAMASSYYEEKRARLSADPPRLLIVDTQDGVVRQMLSRFGFDALLARYDRIAADGGTELYRLKGAAVITAKPSSPVSSSD